MLAGGILPGAVTGDAAARGGGVQGGLAQGHHIGQAALPRSLFGGQSRLQDPADRAGRQFHLIPASFLGHNLKRDVGLDRRHGNTGDVGGIQYLQIAALGIHDLRDGHGGAENQSGHGRYRCCPPQPHDRAPLSLAFMLPPERPMAQQD
jgi:hypothetical protein